MAIEKEKVCELCGGKFIARAYNARFCPDCREYSKKKYNLAYNKAYYHKKKKGYYKPSGKTLRGIMRDLEIYNREHNTHLTYGQYVLKIEGGNSDER